MLQCLGEKKRRASTGGFQKWNDLQEIGYSQKSSYRIKGKKSWEVVVSRFFNLIQLPTSTFTIKLLSALLSIRHHQYSPIPPHPDGYLSQISSPTLPFSSLQYKPNSSSVTWLDLSIKTEDNPKDYFETTFKGGKFCIFHFQIS